MKKITVVSDSHGNRSALDRLNTVFSESDIIIHLGDTSADGSYLQAKFPQVQLLNGNCDPVKLGEDEKIIQAENVKILACHGHLYSVKSTLSRLAARAKEYGCQIALYGHSHRAREDFIDGVTLLNPGALYRYGEKSYLYLVVNGEKFTCKIVPLN